MPDIANAGYFGAGATLPSSPGPADPMLLFTGSGGDFLGRNMAISGNSMGMPGPEIPWFDPSSIDLTEGWVPSYPTPGGGSTSTSDHMNFLAQILGGMPGGALINLLRGRPDQIPAVRLARSIGNFFTPRQSWQENARSNPGSWQGPPAIPPGGALFGYNPNSGGGTPRYNYGTGRTSPTPSTNPLYTTGGAWQPVANAPADVRWQPNSGTGNYQADLTTKNFELAGGYPATQNYHGTPDSGPSRFYNFTNGPMRVDAQGQLAPNDNVDGGLQTYDPAITAQNRSLYAQAVNAVPMGSDGFSAQYVQRVNDWITAHQPSSIFNLVNPSAPVASTNISGPPRLPGT